MSGDKRSSRRGAAALLWTALALVLALAVAACGGSTEDDGKTGTTTASKPGAGADIVFVNPSQGISWTTSMECGARATAARLGSDLKIEGVAQYNVANITQLLAAVAARKPQGVVFPVWDEVAYFNTIDTLSSAGVRVVAIDGTPKDTSNVLSNVTSDNLQGGVLAAEPMLEVARAGDTVLVIQNDPSNRVQTARGSGFIRELEAAGVNVLPIQYSQQDVTKATSIVTSTLARYPDLKGIYVTNGVDAPAVLTALSQQGKKGRVAVISYDATPDQVEQVKNGEILATVAQRPDQEAALGVEYIVNSLNGEDVPRATVTDVALVTKDNLDDPAIQEALYRDEC